MKEEILGGIAANAELGKNDEVGLLLVVCLLAVVENPAGVAGDVADHEVDLGQRYCDPCRS